MDVETRINLNFFSMSSLKEDRKIGTKVPDGIRHFCAIGIFMPVGHYRYVLFIDCRSKKYNFEALLLNTQLYFQ